MRSKYTIATGLLTVAISSALSLGAPAQADPSNDPRPTLTPEQQTERAKQLDQVFIRAINDKHLQFTSDKVAIDVAHSTCDVLARSGNVQDALRHVMNETKWKAGPDVNNFAALSVQAYCPTAMPKDAK